ncbi:MAG: transposase [Blautia wexlerae]
MKIRFSGAWIRSNSCGSIRRRSGSCKIIVVYEVPDQEELPQNGHELAIDLGLHNLMTCYDPGNGKTFILGRKYLALERYFHKEIA